MKLYRNIAIVQTTVASKKEAQKLAALILKKRLGACIQIAPINSFYRWRGKIESANEFLVSVKTTVSIAAKCTAFIKKNHPYELPEIIVTNAKADHDYARWIAKEMKLPTRSNLRGILAKEDKMPQPHKHLIKDNCRCHP